MKFKHSSPRTKPMFIKRLDELSNLKHRLPCRAGIVDWFEIKRTFAASFPSGRGRSALPPRPVVGLQHLQHTFNASDETVVNTWVQKNPYWKYYCGQGYLQTDSPTDPSSHTRWKKRIGEEGAKTVLMATINAARRSGVVEPSSAERVIVDITVMSKAIARRTYSQLSKRPPDKANTNVSDFLTRTAHNLTQRKKDKNELYVLHTSESASQRVS